MYTKWFIDYKRCLSIGQVLIISFYTPKAQPSIIIALYIENFPTKVGIILVVFKFEMSVVDLKRF